MVEIETGSIDFQYGGRLAKFNGMSSQNHVPHYRVLPPGEFNVMSSQSYMCHLAEWKNSIRHIENRIPVGLFYFFVFLMQFLGLGERRLSYRLRYACLNQTDDQSEQLMNMLYITTTV